MGHYVLASMFHKRRGIFPSSLGECDVAVIVMLPIFVCPFTLNMLCIYSNTNASCTIVNEPKKWWNVQLTSKFSMLDPSFNFENVLLFLPCCVIEDCVG